MATPIWSEYMLCLGKDANKKDALVSMVENGLNETISRLTQILNWSFPEAQIDRHDAKEYT